MTEIKAKSVSAQLTESNGNDDLKKDVYFQKYKTLKRKFRKLVEVYYIVLFSTTLNSNVNPFLL